MSDTFESSYTIVTETKDKNKRKIYWDIALYICSLDNLYPSEWFNKLIELSKNCEIEFDELIDKVKNYYGKYEDENFTDVVSNKAECDFRSARIYEVFISGSFSFRPFSPSYIFKQLLQDKYSYMGITRPKEKMIEVFETERQFSYQGLSESEQINHLKSFYSDLLGVQEFANMYNRAVISTYMIWYLIYLNYDLRIYKEVLGGA